MTGVRKRSRHAALFLIGAAAFGLSACQETETDAAAFADVASCKAAADSNGWFSAADCDSAFAEAQVLHDETAPRYDAREVCEEVHGPDACVSEQGGGSGAGIFMPILAGYLIGQALGGGRPAAQPMMQKAGGGFTTPSGAVSVGRLGGSGKIAGAAFDKAPVTKGLAPMTKTQVQARGGFGQTGAGRTVSG